jgi:hypothetical protein
MMDTQDITHKKPKKKKRKMVWVGELEEASNYH